MHHHMAHAEGAGAETGNVAAGLERIGGDLRTVDLPKRVLSRRRSDKG